MFILVIGTTHEAKDADQGPVHAYGSCVKWISFSCSKPGPIEV